MPVPVLLVSLGQSAAIVPEAFLLDGVHFLSVHVITTETTDLTLVREFFAQHGSHVDLTFTRVADFRDLRSESDHTRFEEVLYRWFLQKSPDPARRYVCVAGGFKTMSSAMQKAASLLGAAEVFHVLADSFCGDDGGNKLRPPGSVSEIIEGAAKGRFHWIRLGAESGWPQLRSATASQYPLRVEVDPDGVCLAAAPNDDFRKRVFDVIDRSHRIARCWDQISDLPFAELATWSEADLGWLAEPLNPAAELDRQWVRRLTKLELHCHLGGFATSGELLAAVRAKADKQIPALLPLKVAEGWPLPASPIGLEAYRRLGDNNGSFLLRDPGCLRQQCKLLYEALQQDHVCYAEIRCSPANYACLDLKRSPWDVLRDCLKNKWGPVFAEKALWRGATREHTRQRSVTEEQRSQRAFSAKPCGR